MPPNTTRRWSCWRSMVALTGTRSPRRRTPMMATPTTRRARRAHGDRTRVPPNAQTCLRPPPQTSAATRFHSQTLQHLSHRAPDHRNSTTWRHRPSARNPLPSLLPMRLKHRDPHQRIYQGHSMRRTLLGCKITGMTGSWTHSSARTRPPPRTASS